MNINMNSIMGKVREYRESSAGKRKIKECIEAYRKDGIMVTAAGGTVISEQSMRTAADEFIRILRETAKRKNLPDSVIAHFDSLDCSNLIKLPDGKTVIYVYFGDDLHRDSLENDEYASGYTGDGVKNIVALFNNGVHAGNYVYGWWNGHKPKGESVARAGGDLDEKFAWVRSRKDREGLHFIQEAIDDFIGNYGYRYNITVVPGDDYQ